MKKQTQTSVGTARCAVPDAQRSAGASEPEPYPGYAAEKAALDAKVAAAQRGQSAALPGSLRGAFAGEPRRVTVEGQIFTFQPVSAWLLAILTRLESPLLDAIRIVREEALAVKSSGDPEQLKKLESRIQRRVEKELKPAPDAAMCTVFAFLMPPEACQDLLDGPPKEYARAARGLLGRLHPTSLAELERACGEHFATSFTTSLSISPAPTDDGGGGAVFSQPPPAPKTASVGGCKSSAP